MKCAEVMEWMHRYLDHDLSQDEMIEMFRHIDNCPSCADVFDRLSVLSQQLEQLPDVKPPFSLVDSILPKLDELDRGVHEPMVMSPEESNVVPFSRKSTSGKVSRGASMAARTGIGAVAAAVILLVAIFNMPDSMPNADVEQSLNSGAANMAVNEDTTSKMSVQATETANEGPAESADTADSGNMSLTPQEDESAPAATEKASIFSTVPVEPSSAPNGESAAPSNSKEPALQKRSADTGRKSSKASPGPEAADTSGGNDAEAANREQEILSMKTDDPAADSAPAMKDPLGDSEEQEAGIMGILPSLIASDSSWSSPDGRYSAELAGRQIVIYILHTGEARERTAMTSLPLNGSWVSGEWSEDSRQFTYVTDQKGTQVTEVFTVPDTASSAEPSVSSTPSPTKDGTSSNK